MEQFKRIWTILKRRQSRYLILGVIALAALAYAIPDCRWAIKGVLRNESFYRGKPTSYWREAYWETKNKGKPLASEPESKYWFRVFPPDLKDLIYAEDAPAVDVLIDLLHDDDKRLRNSAAYALGRRRFRAKAAVPQLIVAGSRGLIDYDPYARAMHQIDSGTAKKMGIPEPVWSTTWEDEMYNW